MMISSSLQLSGGLRVLFQASILTQKPEGEMIQQMRNFAVRVVMITLLLIMLGLLISYLMRDSALSLQDILFWVGAAPIAFFSVGIFGSFRGRGDQGYQLSSTVMKQSANQRSVQETNDGSKRTSSNIAWVLGGLLVWLVSYFL